MLLGLGRPVESIAVDGVGAEFTTGNGGPVIETGPFGELVVRRVGSTARG